MDEETQAAFKVSGFDLAGLSFRAHDGLREAVKFLDGRTLKEGEHVVIQTVATVTRTPGGALVFGEVSTRAKSDGA